MKQEADVPGPSSEDHAAPVPAKTAVSFIIPALNEEKHIGRCLQSINDQVIPPWLGDVEVIVVDNRSTDRTAEIARSMGARVIDVPPGRPSRARNTGVRSADGKLLAFVDADCELGPNWLNRCSAHLMENHQAVAAAGVASAPSSESTWVENESYHLAHSLRSSTPQHVRWLPTFNLLVRRTAFDKAGGFDESLVTCEDCDLGYKLSEIGTLVLEPESRVAHHGESRTLTDVFRREAWRSNGNVLLALRRPLDVANWVSLLAPPAIVLGFFIALVGALFALSVNAAVWPWFAILIIVAGLTILLVLRKTRSWKPAALAPQFVVYLTYLAGRTAGLFWAFRRLER